MKTLQIVIINPKARKLLKGLVAMNLISIREPNEKAFLNLVKKLRPATKNPPTFAEITQEVEIVRTKRYRTAMKCQL